MKVTQNNGAGVMPAVTWSSVNHTASNVPIYAQGENAFLISGLMDNTEMFFVCTCTPGEGAWRPTPSDGAANHATKATLKWLGSEDAACFDIYFGTDFNDVNYIDDVNDIDPNHICKGDVWIFTVTDEVNYLYEIDVRVSSGIDDAVRCDL